MCYLCGLKIASGEPWQADHELARELGGSDEEANLRPAHVDCHRLKSKADVKLIAKGNRIIRERGPIEQRRKRTSIPQHKAKAFTAMKPKTGFQTNRNGAWKKKMSGEIVRR